MDLKYLLDELCYLETVRVERALDEQQTRRWLELQRLLQRAMCDFATAGDERRTRVRVPCPLRVRLASDELEFDGTAIDIGEGGIGVQADLLPALGERLVLLYGEGLNQQSQLGRFELHLPGHVVWMRKAHSDLGPGFGVAFDPQTREQESRLAQLLLTLLRQRRANLPS